LPLPEEVVMQDGMVHHPLAAHDYQKTAFDLRRRA